MHATLRRWAEEQFAGLEDKSHARTRLRKVDFNAMQEVKKLSENPDIGAYRVSAALEYQHPYHLPQLPLWSPADVEWHVIIRCEAKVRRRRRLVQSFVIQLPLHLEANGMEVS